jgi:tripartite motif-containing protein 71
LRPGSFNVPNGVAVDDWGRVYVADELNNRVQVFDTHGRLIEVIGTRFLARWGRDGADGTPGSGDGEFIQPRGLAADHAGHLCVIDKANKPASRSPARRPVRAPPGSARRRRDAGARNGEFRVPVHGRDRRRGRPHVADTANNRIQKFGPTGR